MGFIPGRFDDEGYASNILFCPQKSCGKLILDSDAIFCPFCGKRIKETRSNVVNGKLTHTTQTRKSKKEK